MDHNDPRISDELRQMLARLLQLCEERLGQPPQGPVPQDGDSYYARLGDRPVVWLCAIGVGNHRNTVHLSAEWHDSFGVIEGVECEGRGTSWGRPPAHLWAGPAQEAQAVAFIDLAIEVFNSR
jgi:hypothetical protein